MRRFNVGNAANMFAEEVQNASLLTPPAPPAITLTSAGNLWEPDVDPAEWPEMREYVSPAELNAYSDLCNSVAAANTAKGPTEVGAAKLPPAPVRLTLGLSDLADAEAAKAVSSGGAGEHGGGGWQTSKTVFILWCRVRSRIALNPTHDTNQRACTGG